MSVKEISFETIPSLQDTQDHWALKLLACQAKFLKILAKENLLTNAKKIPLEYSYFRNWEIKEWNHFRKTEHLTFAELVNISVNIKSSANKEKVLPIIKEIHLLRLNLINSFVPLVQFIAKKYAHQNASLFSDLTAEGYLGLLKCLDSFYYVDPMVHIKKYVMYYVKQEMRRFLLENRRGFRIPYMASVKQSKSVSPHKKLQISKVQYFEDINGNDDYEENIPSPSTKNPEEKLWDKTLKEILGQILETLPEKERTVLMVHYGLNHNTDYDKKISLRQIGEKMSLSKERARQLEKKALEHLHHIAKDVLKKIDLEDED